MEHLQRWSRSFPLLDSHPSLCRVHQDKRRSFPQAIKSPRPQETKSSHSSNVIVITALQRDKKILLN